MSGPDGASLLLDDPFYSGSTASSDVPWLVPCALGGHGYNIDPKLYERQTIERFRNPYTSSDEPGEHSLSLKGPWLRSDASWADGAGQIFWDHPKADRDRFRVSKGIDIWTDKHRLQLLYDTRNIRASGNSNLKVMLVGAYQYIVDGTNVLWTTDPTGASPTYTSSVINIAEGAQTVTDFTTDGTFVYAAVGVNGIHKTALGASVSTHFSAFAATIVQYANGNLVAGAANVISSIDNAGTATTLLTHRNSSFIWNTITPAPNGIYAAGNAGDRAEIYFIGLKTDHSLDVPIFAASLPDGETINTMQFYNGVMVLATSIGLRLADITQVGPGLQYNSAIAIPGGVVALEPQGEFVWFSWSNYDGASTGLGRLSLAVFVDTNVPAYASDLMATAQGTVTAVATFGTRRYFCVSGIGFFAEFTDRVASGSLASGWTNFGTGERKVAISLDLRHEPLPAGSSISAAITEEDASTTTIGASQAALSLGPMDPLSIGAVTSESFELILTFNRATDTTASPKLRRWTLRALITPVRYDEIFLPIIMREKDFVVDLGDGHEHELNPLDEWLFLKDLESSGSPTVLQLGTVADTVYVEQVGSPADENRKWTPDRHFLEGIVMVHLVTL